jgi:hypothetical protein
MKCYRLIKICGMAVMAAILGLMIAGCEIDMKWCPVCPAEPTAEPTGETAAPTAETPPPTPGPTAEVTGVPTVEPTTEVTAEPTPELTEVPTEEPTEVPTAELTQEPTPDITEEPTAGPTPFNYLWTQLAAINPPTPPRSSVGMIYDANGNIIIMGGGDDSGAFSDVFKYNIASNTWTQLPTGPSRRGDPSAIYDGSGNMIIFGGNNPPPFGDVWKYNITGQTWAQLVFATK